MARAIRPSRGGRYIAVTLPLHCRYVAVMLPSHCRHIAVTLPLRAFGPSRVAPLHCRYVAVTLPLHYRYSTVTLSLHCRYIAVTFTVTVPLHFARGALFPDLHRDTRISQICVRLYIYIIHCNTLRHICTCMRHEPSIIVLIGNNRAPGGPYPSAALPEPSPRCRWHRPPRAAQLGGRAAGYEARRR